MKTLFKVLIIALFITVPALIPAIAAEASLEKSFELEDLEDLEWLTLKNTALTDRGLNFLKPLVVTLKNLDLAHTKITDRGVWPDCEIILSLVFFDRSTEWLL